MIYLDANVFIFALSDEPRGIKARAVLTNVVTGKAQAVTSALTIDEVMWILWKETKDRSQSIEQTLRILAFENIRIIPVDHALMRNALLTMQKYTQLKPRDAVHLATCLHLGISTIVSDDSDFDKIPEVKRQTLR